MTYLDWMLAADAFAIAVCLWTCAHECAWLAGWRAWLPRWEWVDIELTITLRRTAA